jgi:hypothetical protein
MLRVDDRALEALAALELGREALVVAVVAAAHEQEAAREPDRLLRVGAQRLDRPSRVLGRPLGPDDPMVEADPPVDPVLPRGLADVVEDRRAVGDRLRVWPRPEAVAERVHIGVRAHAGITEQVPGAAERLAGLEDRPALAGAPRLEVIAGGDPGEAGADHEHIEMLDVIHRCKGYTSVSCGV